jgi:hypothetical protein
VFEAIAAKSTSQMGYDGMFSLLLANPRELGADIIFAQMLAAAAKLAQAVAKIGASTGRFIL